VYGITGNRQFHELKIQWLWLPPIFTEAKQKKIGKEVVKNTTERHDIIWHTSLKKDWINKSKCPRWK